MLHDYYDVKNSIASGAYGLVYKGFHKITRECVAIKMIKKSKLTELELD